MPVDTMCHFSTDGSTTGLPAQTVAWLYATGLILRRYKDVKIILYAYSSADVAYNYYSDSTGKWTGWVIK